MGAVLLPSSRIPGLLRYRSHTSKTQIPPILDLHLDIQSDRDTMMKNLFLFSKAVNELACLNQVFGSAARQSSGVLVESVGNCNKYHSSSGDAAASSKRNIRKNAPVKILTTGKSVSAGRNSLGRITIYHRGGGAKRLQRTIDLKRSTSSMGIVERIEYDPNRSSRIALVRWIEGVRPRKPNTADGFSPTHKIIEPTPVSLRGQFSFCSLPGKVYHEKVDGSSPGTAEAYVDGRTSDMPALLKRSVASKDAGSKKSCVRDVLLSAFSSSKAEEETAFVLLSSSSSFPRVAVAGAKPAYFAAGMSSELSGKDMFSLCDVQKWRTNSTHSEHRIKRKAAISWQSLKQGNLGFVAAVEHNKSKQSGKGSKDGASNINRAPVTYIIASHNMEVGRMVMNCDWSRPTTSNF
uniref:60S ribosomal protein L2, mitochondrial n=1 Tax=Melianthus villosus TaxID=377280 RepID=A0A0G2YMJ8_9ROSI|nr:ribosomal protein L2 [Melianthus villosus]